MNAQNHASLSKCWELIANYVNLIWEIAWETAQLHSVVTIPCARRLVIAGKERALADAGNMGEQSVTPNLSDKMPNI